MNIQNFSFACDTPKCVLFIRQKCQRNSSNTILNGFFVQLCFVCIFHMSHQKSVHRTLTVRAFASKFPTRAKQEHIERLLTNRWAQFGIGRRLRTSRDACISSFLFISLYYTVFLHSYTRLLPTMQKLIEIRIWSSSSKLHRTNLIRTRLMLCRMFCRLFGLHPI